MYWGMECAPFPPLTDIVVHPLKVFREHLMQKPQRLGVPNQTTAAVFNCSVFAIFRPITRT